MCNKGICGVFVFLFVCVGAPDVFAADGQMEATVSTIESPFLRGPELVACEVDMEVAPAGAKGLVSKDAIVARLRSMAEPHPFIPKRVAPTGDIFNGAKVYVAFDKDRPDAAELNVFRFDFVGDKDFSRNAAIATKPFKAGGSTGRRSEEVTIRAVTGGRALLLRCSCSASNLSEGRFMWFAVSSAIAGECSFGDKKHRVMIMDNHGNLDYRDKCQVQEHDDVVKDLWEGDIVIVDLDDGSFKKPDARYTGFYGEPVFVDGAWWDLVLDEKMRLTAKKTDLKPAQVVVPGKTWAGTLIGGGRVFHFEPHKAPVNVPAGKYVLLRYEEGHNYDERRWETRADFLWRCSAAAPMNGRGRFDVLPGVANELKIGPPMKVVPVVPDGEHLHLEITDVSGTRCEIWRESKPPTLIISDPTGEEVFKKPHKGFDAPWPLKLLLPLRPRVGTYVVKVEWDDPPVPMKLEKGSFEVKQSLIEK